MSEKNEEIDDYAAQNLEIMNTMEATQHFWAKWDQMKNIFDSKYKGLRIVSIQGWLKSISYEAQFSLRSIFGFHNFNQKKILLNITKVQLENWIISAISLKFFEVERHTISHINS